MGNGNTVNYAEYECRDIVRSNFCFSKKITSNGIKYDQASASFGSDPPEPINQRFLLSGTAYIDFGSTYGEFPRWDWSSALYTANHSQSDVSVGSVYPFTSYYTEKSTSTGNNISYASVLANAGNYVEDISYIPKTIGSDSNILVMSVSPAAYSGLTNETTISGCVQNDATGCTLTEDDFEAICHPYENAVMNYQVKFSTQSTCPSGQLRDCDG